MNVGGDKSSDLNSQGVFLVSYLGQFSDLVISSSVSITSGVGLMLAQNVPKFGGIKATTFKFPIEFSKTVPPREMQTSFRCAPNGCAGCIDGLIEPVFDIVEGFRGLPGNSRWQFSYEADFVDRVTGLRVPIDTARKRTSFCKLS